MSKCNYYNNSVCCNPNNPANRNRGSTYTGADRNKCSLRSEDCVLNGGRSRGYCGYYNYNDSVCYNPYNPDNRDIGNCETH
jgi:hypothetical protein